MAEEQVHQTWLSSDRPIPKLFVRPLLRFTRVEASSGIVLLVAAAAALIWANAPFGESYETFWNTEVALEAGPIHLEESLREWVNDGLMAIFFLVVGMEIKRELVVGDLRDRKTAALPVIAAVGGMVVPALFYIGFVLGGDATGEATRGWGIPMATDIAFSIGVIALLGARVPVGAKLFLLALAIVDDIGAIAVIAVFYTDDLNVGWLAAAVAGVVIIWSATRVGIRSVLFYVIAGFFTWLFLLESGVHATLAGVAIGLITPARPLYGDVEYRRMAHWILDRFEMDSRAPRRSERLDAQALELSVVARESVSPLARQEAAIHPWSSFLIVPIFALANAGIRFSGIDLGDAITHPVTIGVGVGLLAGKFIGISLATWLAVRFGWGRLPRLTNWTHILGVAALAGIGFTVSLFIASLAFTDVGLTDRAKIGIFAGSTLSGILGYLVLRTMRFRAPAAESAYEEEAAG